MWDPTTLAALPPTLQAMLSLVEASQQKISPICVQSTPSQVNFLQSNFILNMPFFK